MPGNAPATTKGAYKPNTKVLSSSSMVKGGIAQQRKRTYSDTLSYNFQNPEVLSNSSHPTSFKVDGKLV